MKPNRRFSMGAIVALVLVGAFSLASGLPPEEEPNKERPAPKVDTPPPTPEQPPSLAAPGLGWRSTQIDSTMLRMSTLIEQSESLSKSFAQLAQLHHGADKSEVLMMQRMSDAMGAMAEEVRASLDVYKKMLGDETASDTGTMKEEVEGLKGILDGIAVQIDLALTTLQRLRLQLGQG